MQHAGWTYGIKPHLCDRRRGWAELSGQTLAITQNIALFALLGTHYGGNGQTTFALPDMRDRVLIDAGVKALTANQAGVRVSIKLATSARRRGLSTRQMLQGAIVHKILRPG